MLKIGLFRKIEEDDLYTVTDSMRSTQNTGKFAELWQLELKKTNPSIFRVIIKMSGLEYLTWSLLYLAADTAGR